MSCIKNFLCFLYSDLFMYFYIAMTDVNGYSCYSFLLVHLFLSPMAFEQEDVLDYFVSKLF